MATTNAVNNKPAGGYSLPAAVGSNGQVLTSNGTNVVFQTPAGTSFTPTDVPDLYIWLDSSTGTFQNSDLTTTATADNDPIGGWTDASGNGFNFLQTVNGNRPTLKLNIANSRSAIRFTAASSHYLTAGNTPLTTVNDLTVILVGSPTSNTGTALSKFDNNIGFIYGYGNMDRFQFLSSGSNTQQLNLSSGAQFDKYNTSNIPRILVGSRGKRYNFDCDGRINNALFNQSIQAGTGPGTGTLTINTTALTVGSRSNATDFFNGDIYGVLIYTRRLNTKEIQNLVEWASDRWSI